MDCASLKANPVCLLMLALLLKSLCLLGSCICIKFPTGCHKRDLGLISNNRLPKSEAAKVEKDSWGQQNTTR